MTQEKTTIRLNVGAGDAPMPDYVNLDIKSGVDCRALPYEDDSVDEIRASHVLEHFPRAETMATIRHWRNKLKPGGLLKIAVPDIDWLIDHRFDGDEKWEAYILGGQTDETDQHKALFNFHKLEELCCKHLHMEEFGRFASDWKDCSSHPCSLNVQCRKPLDNIKSLPNVHIVMSMPRVGFTDNFLSVVTASRVFDMPFIKTSGAFWGQCLERVMAEQIDIPTCEWILTVDYDSIFHPQHVMQLYRTALRNDCDALFAVQSKRESPFILTTVRGENGVNKTHIDRADMDKEVLECATGHFGLTLIRASKLRELKHPWFLGHPAPDGTWGEGRTDDDIHFWRRWAEAGLKVHQANRVKIGHFQGVVTWPDANWQARHQYLNDFYKDGQPVWSR